MPPERQKMQTMQQITENREKQQVKDSSIDKKAAFCLE